MVFPACAMALFAAAAVAFWALFGALAAVSAACLAIAGAFFVPTLLMALPIFAIAAGAAATAFLTILFTWSVVAAAAFASVVVAFSQTFLTLSAECCAFLARFA